MSSGNPQQCKRGCGAYIYFDSNSPLGHPSADKWLPLEYNNDAGVKTGVIHQCPNRSNGHQQQTTAQQSSTTVVTQKTREDLIMQMLSDINVKMNRVIKALEGQQPQT